MARKINYIDPVDSVQGLLGSKQDLRYAENNNKGYYSPAGKVNSARNYQTRMVGMVRTRTGKKYYAIRKKSSFNANPATLHACALMSAARLIANSWLRDLSIVTWAQAYWKKHILEHQFRTFYQWMFNEAYWRINAGQTTWTLDDDGVIRSLGCSPWQIEPDLDTMRNVSEVMTIKFWSELVRNGCYIYINGRQLPAISTWYFQEFEDNDYVNILGMQVVGFKTKYYMKIGDYFLTYRDGTYVQPGQNVVPDVHIYFTTKDPS